MAGPERALQDTGADGFVPASSRLDDKTPQYIVHTFANDTSFVDAKLALTLTSDQKLQINLLYASLRYGRHCMYARTMPKQPDATILQLARLPVEPKEDQSPFCSSPHTIHTNSMRKLTEVLPPVRRLVRAARPAPAGACSTRSRWTVRPSARSSWALAAIAVRWLRPC